MDYINGNALNKESPSYFEAKQMRERLMIGNEVTKVSKAS